VAEGQVEGVIANRIRWGITRGVSEQGGLPFDRALAMKSGAANSWNGKSRNHLPTMGTLCGLTPGSSENRDRGGPIGGEPHGASDPLRNDVSFHPPGVPIRTASGSAFQGAGSRRINLIDTSARRLAARGARGHSVLNRHKVRMTKAFPMTALIPVITGTGIGGTEELWPRRSR
jgi:hypothetical protein